MTSLGDLSTSRFLLRLRIHILVCKSCARFHHPATRTFQLLFFLWERAVLHQLIAPLGRSLMSSVLPEETGFRAECPGGQMRYWPSSPNCFPCSFVLFAVKFVMWILECILIASWAVFYNSTKDLPSHSISAVPRIILQSSLGASSISNLPLTIEGSGLLTVFATFWLVVGERLAMNFQSVCCAQPGAWFPADCMIYGSERRKIDLWLLELLIPFLQVFALLSMTWITSFIYGGRKLQRQAQEQIRRLLEEESSIIAQIEELNNQPNVARPRATKETKLTPLGLVRSPFTIQQLDEYLKSQFGYLSAKALPLLTELKETRQSIDKLVKKHKLVSTIRGVHEGAPIKWFLEDFLPFLASAWCLYLPRTIFLGVQATLCGRKYKNSAAPGTLFSTVCTGPGSDLTLFMNKFLATMTSLTYALSVSVILLQKQSLRKFSFSRPTGLELLAAGYRRPSGIVSVIRFYALCLIPVSLLSAPQPSGNYRYAVAVHTIHIIIMGLAHLNDHRSFGLLELADLVQVLTGLGLALLSTVARREELGETVQAALVFVGETGYLSMLAILGFSFIVESGRLVSYRFYMPRSGFAMPSLRLKPALIRWIYQASHWVFFRTTSWFDISLRINAGRDYLILNEFDAPSKPEMENGQAETTGAVKGGHEATHQRATGDCLKSVARGLRTFATGRALCNASQETLGFISRLCFLVVHSFRTDLMDIQTQLHSRPAFATHTDPHGAAGVYHDQLDAWARALARQRLLNCSCSWGSSGLGSTWWQLEARRNMIAVALHLRQPELFEFMEISSSEMVFAVDYISKMDYDWLATVLAAYMCVSRPLTMRTRQVALLQDAIKRHMGKLRLMVEARGRPDDSELDTRITEHYSKIAEVNRLHLAEHAEMASLLDTQVQALDQAAVDRQLKLQVTGQTDFSQVDSLLIVKNELIATRAPLDLEVSGVNQKSRDLAIFEDRSSSEDSTSYEVEMFPKVERKADLKMPPIAKDAPPGAALNFLPGFGEAPAEIIDTRSVSGEEETEPTTVQDEFEILVDLAIGKGS